MPEICDAFTDMDLIRVVDVDFIEGYTMLLTFSNGVSQRSSSMI